ncbi:MAG: hypothetical protein IVW55_16640 [Chloroflexi bacterium]|nr:hypothetical protein [Chloroflexota bacterium]
MNSDSPSQIEDLDPEPLSKGVNTQAIELVLGLLLLVGVLAFAGWQWWQTESNQRNYQAGQQAAARYDWDAAQSLFRAADGYKDAATLAQNAEGNIDERNKDYAAALAYADQGKWIEAFQAISATIKIQPNYRDLPKMENIVEGHVYDEALLGSVVQWPSASPPGLYYRAKIGWVWLKDSDQYSDLQFGNRPNSVVYDVPGPGWVPPTTRQDQGNIRGSPEQQNKEGREAIVAWIDPSVTSDTLKLTKLPVKLDRYPPTVWGRQGAWITANAFNAWYGSTTPVYHAMSPMAPLTYVPLDGTAPTTLTLTAGLSRPALLTLDSSYDDLLLLADWTTSADNSSIVTVYLADASGGKRRVLYTHPGGIEKAQFSSDGKHVLLTTYTTKGGYTLQDLSLVLLDAMGGQAPIVLAEQHDIPTSDMLLNGPMRSTYIDHGPFAGKVLVAEWIGGSNRVTLVDPARPQTPLSRLTVPGSAILDWSNLILGDDRLLLLGYPYARSSSGPKLPGDREVLVSMKVGEGFKMSYIDAPARIYSMSLHGGRLLLSGEQWPPDQANSPGYSLSALPLSSVPQDTVQPRLTYNPTFPSDSPGFSTGPSISLGENAFSYLDGRDLHVRAYDSLVDIKLLSGISTLWPSLNEYSINSIGLR